MFKNETVSVVEALKGNSQHLRGTIREELDNDLPGFSKPATGILKFHGMYQQEDRDLRKQHGERAYRTMVRVGIPGGHLSAHQYLELDRLADHIGDGSIRITSRQDLQYHGVGKHSLRELISRLHTIDLSTFAACGDVVRNIVSCAAPIGSVERQQILRHVLQLASELKPRTRAYYDIWLDGQHAASLEQENEPLYGETYLPRKFKIGFAVEGENTTDIYSNDLGFVAHCHEGMLAGFTLLAGGGLGQSNGISASHARLADPIAFIQPEQLTPVAKAAVSIHRDFGNRHNRHFARLKYLIEAWGVERFREELEFRLGQRLGAPRPLVWYRGEDYLGWHPQGDGRWFCGIRVLNGRLRDTGRQRIRSGIREVVERLSADVRLTAQQNLLIANVVSEQRSQVDQLLHRHGIIPAASLPPVLRHSMACPALPTCGQALSESERVWPQIANEIQKAWDAAGLTSEPLCVRMTGCPNGCARPYTAEIGIVGQSSDLYSLYLGGSPLGTRLAEIFRHGVRGPQIAAVLSPLFQEYAAERKANERFGNWFVRSIIGSSAT
jgi:sulfite reductase (ferredoxin)